MPARRIGASPILWDSSHPVKGPSGVESPSTGLRSSVLYMREHEASIKTHASVIRATAQLVRDVGGAETGVVSTW